MDTDTKIDLILGELKNIRVQIDERFDKVDEKFNNIDKRFDNLDRRITSLKADNLEEHTKIMQLLTSLNSAFLRYETEGLDKIKILKVK